ncbi:hypothetical protein HA075_19115 [bacterium BFN5]|nr:hypothetical protein HA075_19115 [bacterium BFN5]
MYSHWASNALTHYLRTRAYLMLYIWVFMMVWLTVRYSLSGLFTLGTIIPVYLYVRYIDIRQPLEFLKLDRKNFITGYLWGIVLAVSFTAILAVKVHYGGQGNIYYKWPVMDVLNIVIVASLVEEIFFRGFLLQKLMEATSFAKANIMVTLSAKCTIFINFIQIFCHLLSLQPIPTIYLITYLAEVKPTRVK